jgi:hypothetical protein
MTLVNRLSAETSLYLKQHANNPVAWQPWDETSLQLARELDRPIFLSIGYSACHWCHVMEHESFENPRIAELLNQWFVSIKVDREERPDLDQIYMAAVVAMTDQGGWPMSVFLTPQGEPFYGGTYFPPTSRYGRPGFAEVLAAIHDAWETRREVVTEQAAQLTDTVRTHCTQSYEKSALGENLLDHAGRTLVRVCDRVHGGFGQAPKFPHAMDLRLALRLAHRFDTTETAEVAQIGLEAMARGGIHDHLGGGFARYATDERWLVPHFEKMLYDNALLLSAYVDGWQYFKTDFVRRTAQSIVDYVLREMQVPSHVLPGGFCAAQDADSEGEEGRYFVWSLSEIRQVLAGDPAGNTDSALFERAYGVTAEGNWEGRTILHLPMTLAALGREFGLSESAIDGKLATLRAKLFEHRSRRVAPARDEKLIVAWNGLMISALARAGAVLGDARALEAAQRAARAILDQAGRSSLGLPHSIQEGVPRQGAYLDDYGCFLEALVDLFLVDADPFWLTSAAPLIGKLFQEFHDEDQGGFYYVGRSAQPLISRSRDFQDNVTPSGNSTVANALLKYSRLTGDALAEERTYQTLAAASGLMRRSPMATAHSLAALDLWLGPTYECVYFPAAGTDTTSGLEGESDAVIQAMRDLYLPHVLFVKGHAGLVETLAGGLVEGRLNPATEPSLYVCEKGTCQLPIVGETAIISRLKELARTLD